MSIDVNYVGGLLKIVELCAGHSGKLGALSNAASSELFALNDKLRQEAIEKAKAAQAEADAKAAEAAAKARAEAEEKAAAEKAEQEQAAADAAEQTQAETENAQTPPPARRL